MRCTLAAALVLGLCPMGLWEAASAQPGTVISTTSDPVIIVPQGRHVVIWPMPRPAGTVKLTSVDTKVEITDQVASTTLVMSVTNTGGGQQQAELLVPVPEGASVRSFQLDSAGSEPTAKILPRDEARRIYNAIVSKSRDPGLLEFAGYNAIRSSVFPVPAGGSQTLRLTYEQLLTADGSDKSDRIDYALPRTDSLEQTGVTWTFSADIRSKRPISTVYSPSHEIVTERLDPEHVSIHLRNASAAQPGSFRLSYLLPRDGDDLAASVLFYPDPDIGDGKGGYFLLLTGMPARTPDAQKIKREVTIVLDRSGSMRGEKIAQAREAALQVVEGLHDGESFNIIDYSDSIASFAEKPVVKTDDTTAKARAYLKGVAANGGTNIHDAVIEAVRQQPTEGDLPVVLFLTDGLPTVGQTSEAAIKEAATAANTFHRRIFTFGVGFDVNAPLLRGLSLATRASSAFVLPEENVEIKVGSVFRKLSGPVLASPTLTASVEAQGGARDPVVSRPIREVQPAALPDVFEGDQLVVLGQYTDASARKLILSGNFLGKDRTFEFSFDPSKASTRNAFVPRLWASRKIASLIEQIRQNAGSEGAAGQGSKELVDEIVRLSTKWGILTEYTAFLAVEPGMAMDPRMPAPIIVGGGGKGGALAPMPVEAQRRAANIDLFDEPNAPASGAPSRAKAGYALEQRAEKERVDKGGMNQELNLGRMASQSCENKSNAFYTKDLQRVEVTSVCQVADQTLFRRSNRWVDANLLDKQDAAPEKTIAFASDEYYALADDLASRGRQGLLAQGGDCYLLYKGQRVLVQGPETP